MSKDQQKISYAAHYEDWQLPEPEPETLARLQQLAEASSQSSVLFSRQDLEFLASGKISKLFGPAFAQQDDYSLQVRMPQPPLLMVDRILSISGEIGALSPPCRIRSETDVKADAWYSHEGYMLPGMAMEAGQADLLLISWMGIDKYNQGKRVYRVVGADVTLHGDLPKAGETLSYEISVDRLAQLGDIRLMFFQCQGFINGERRISVRNAHAGFFTPEELKSGTSVFWNPEKAIHRAKARFDPPKCLTQFQSFSHEQVQAFANGNTLQCFGPGFESAQRQGYSPRIPSGQAALLYDIPKFDPKGGPKGKGYLLARQKVTADDWFFKAHFKNDPCMPGSLMLDAGFQAVSFYLAALGFTLDRDGWRFTPIPDLEMNTHCHGQCTPENKEVLYEIFVEEVIAEPWPSVIVDLLISVDGRKAIHIHHLSSRLVPGDKTTSIQTAANVDLNLLEEIRRPIHVLKNPLNQQAILLDGQRHSLSQVLAEHASNYITTLPAVYPETLGDPGFLTTHQVRFPYVVGEMANGIASAECVIAAVRSGFFGSFGAGGLMPELIEKNLRTIHEAVGKWSGWGANLIHSPNEPALEEATVNLFLRLGLRHISASAYMSLSPAVVQFAYSGLYLDDKGEIQRPNHVLAKISRPEVARPFMLPASAELLQTLVDQGKLTAEEARLAQFLPVAEDITAEADSGGHTDRRPSPVLFPLIYDLAQQISQQQNYTSAIRVGAAGGLGSPAAVAAAFAMGAAYVVTGSINQSAVEAGISDAAKTLLARCDMTDVEMAPAADMFELGVKLQVLKRGSLFSRRANKLYEIYSKYPSLEAIPQSEQDLLQKTIFLEPLANVWEKTKQFFTQRDPQQIIRAERDAKYQMALVFRSYLGLASRWAIKGDQAHALDYQIWCGPAMGGFNAWVAGSFLEKPENRSIQQIGLNLLEGAAIITRAQQLRSYGLLVPSAAFSFRPRELSCTTVSN